EVPKAPDAPAGGDGGGGCEGGDPEGVLGKSCLSFLLACCFQI
nr:hypothetical protein [Tanacetum cinerariifolium]